MGFLLDGQWHDRPMDAAGEDGRFMRRDAQFRNWVTADGSPGPSGEGGFRAEPGRFHLYVSYACPWAQRTLIYRAVKGLEDLIGLSAVHWLAGESGWTFQHAEIPDAVNHADHLYQIYLAADPGYGGRVTVPTLWDKQRRTIVSNESADIIRMFNTAFDAVGARPGDYYPPPLRAEIDALNERVYHTVNNGVYRAGFATTQAAYEEAVVPLFETLDWLEARLQTQRYLTGNTVTEADWRLLTTLLRFDPVYVGHFKCNLRRLADYPSLSGYTRDLYQQPGIAQTLRLDHVKLHYYRSHAAVNPTRIVPVGPQIDYAAPHDRARLG